MFPGQSQHNTGNTVRAGVYPRGQAHYLGVCLLFCSYLKLLGSLFPGDMPSGVSVEKE